MKKSLFIICLISIIAQNFGNLYSIIRFTINQEKIAKTLCVKRNEPKSCCKGKCQLEKELIQNQAGDNNQNSNTQKIEKLELSPFISADYSDFSVLPLSHEKSSSNLIHFKIQDYESFLFHPPPILIA